MNFIVVLIIAALLFLAFHKKDFDIDAVNEPGEAFDEYFADELADDKDDDMEGVSIEAEEHFDYAAKLGINFLPFCPQNDFSEHAEEMREAAKNPDPEVLRQLLHQAVDVNLVDENGWTGLMWAAAKNNNPEVIKLFIKYGADVNAPTAIGWSVVMLAAIYNQNPEIIRTLVKEGADLQKKDEEGNSVLDYAAENRNQEVLKVVEELLKVK